MLFLYVSRSVAAGDKESANDTLGSKHPRDAGATASGRLISRSRWRNPYTRRVGESVAGGIKGGGGGWLVVLLF